MAVSESIVTPTASRWRVVPRWAYAVIAVLLGWILGWRLFANSWNLPLQSAEVTPLHLWLNDVNDWIGNNRDSNPVFVYIFDSIRGFVGWVASIFTQVFVQTDVGLQLPEIGWLGVVALIAWIAWLVGNYKVAILTALGFAALGFLGVFTAAMATFALTVTAVVFSLVVGIPLGVWAGLNLRVERVVTPVLDFMQTLPSFVYLAPLALLFLIGPPAAVIATVIYAAPPVIRLTAHGIRTVPASIGEAVDSLGANRRQRLWTVLLPLARSAIVVGISQTVMAALSMVTIAALIAAPGLGQLVLQALQSLNIGDAVVAGSAIVILAIVLDRVTTAASMRSEINARTSNPRRKRLRGIALVAGSAVAFLAIFLSRTVLWAAQFPTPLIVGGWLSSVVNVISLWLQGALSIFTTNFRDGFTVAILNPFESLLTESPFLLVALVVLSLALLFGGARPTIVSGVCLALIVASGLWEDAMVTLASTLIATLITMALGIVVGVAMGRSARVDSWLRPSLDAAQTMPAFVYLIPFLGLFGPSRFTAIVAAVVYAAPVSIKIIAEGIAAVSSETVEAAQSSGASPWQTITKVQLPLASSSIALATNQGLIYVLAMVVVGGLVGGGALGYDVVAGFSQISLFGKGFAAGIAIVLLGIMLDRITQAAAKRDRTQSSGVRRTRLTTAPAMH